MSKTSIDGLVVRSSDEKKPVVRPSAHRVVGHARSAMPLARSTHKNTAKKHKSASKVSAKDEFLAPLSTYDDDRDDATLGAIDEADWSELLNDFGNDEHDDNLGLERHLTEFGDTPKERKSKQKRDRRAKKIKKKRRFFLLRHPILTTIVIVLVATGVGVFAWGDSLISRLTSGRSGIWDAIGAMVSTTIPFDTDQNGRTNILVFGTEGYDMDGTSGNGVHDGSQLTDSIMVVSFDQDTQDVALLSLPRDLKVPMACMAGKVNEVYMCNNQNGQDEEAGAKALMTQLTAVLGIDFQYWAHVNWGSVAEIVDSLGGITVVLDEDVSDYYYTTIVIKAGVPTHLSGVEAVALARARHGTIGGDFSRGNSQQKIVEGIVREFVNNGVNITEALSLLNILGDNLRTNFSTDNIKAGVKLASSFNMGNIRNVQLINYNTNTYYVTTANINGLSYVVPSAGAGDYSAIHRYVSQMFSSDVAVREGGSIAIFNATSTSGLAGAERVQLETKNFTVSTIGDASEGSCGEKYCLYALNEAMPGTKAALEERYGVTALGVDALPAGIWSGVADFVLVIGGVDEE